MKIGIDARFWNETGVGRYIRNLVTQLEVLDTKNDYVLFTLEQDAHEVRSSLSSKKFKIVPTTIHWHSLKEQLKFPAVLNSENLDFMHFPYFSVPIFYNRPFVVTIHDLIIHHFATGEATTLPLPLYRLKVQAYKYIISQAATKACQVIAVSSATESEIIDHLHVPMENVTVTYEGVDKSMSEVRSQKSEVSYGKYFLHVGNVYPHKNAKRLVEAFAQANLDNVELLFVGKKDAFMTELEKFVNKKQLSRIKFLGFVEDDKLSFLYSEALATVVPSLMEGFGLPVLEAMANDSLVLASDIPSLKEVAKDAALYCDPFQISDISAKMQQIAQSKKSEFEEYRTKGKKLTKEFTWEKMAEETLQVYESCFSIRQDK